MWRALVGCTPGYLMGVGLSNLVRWGGEVMCNLYSVTKGQQAIREFTKALHDVVGNMPPLPGVFPDYAPETGTDDACLPHHRGSPASGLSSTPAT